MEIGYLVNQFPSLSETFILNQITGLIERGHRVHIIAASRGTERDRHLDVDRFDLENETRYFHQEPGPGRRRRALWFVVSESVRSPGTVYRSLGVRLSARHVAFSELLKAAFVCRDLPELDVLHCQYGPNGVFGLQLRQIGAVRAPIVTTFHGWDIRMAQSKGSDIYKALRESGDEVIAISSSNRRALEGFGFAPERISDHPVGIRLKDYAFRWDVPSGSADGEVDILTVGRLVWEKGHKYALDALHRLRKRHPRLAWRYKIIGDGPARGQLIDQATRLGLIGDVELCGARPNEYVRSALQRADLFLLPSVAEVLPVALMEAAASGLPVVATDVGSVADIIEDGISGLLAPPGDVEALADRLQRLLLAPDRWEAMGRAGRDRIARRFDVDVLNDRLVELLRRVAGV